MFYGFQGLSKHIPLSFKDNGLDHIGSNTIPNNIVLLVTINKFDHNPILVNINKLKPYRFMEDQTLQFVLTNPNDFLLEKPMKVTHFDNTFTKQ
jgi:hypothetical protein